MTLRSKTFDRISFSIHPAEENMAIDEVLFQSVYKGMRLSTFRLYAWDKPSITIGYFQKSANLNLSLCKDHNIPVIRRMTGGRAVYHHKELTYSIIFKGKESIEKHKKRLFRELSDIILSGLKEMGVEGVLSSKTQGEAKNPNCFQTTSLCEIMSPEGKKLVGSAMLVQNGIIIMQGSIPLSDSYQQISYYLNRSTDMGSQEIGDWVIDQGVIKAFLNGVQEEINLSPSKLTSTEEKDVKDLIESKYQREDWNFRR
ncbi:MAG: octanoyltransferase LipM [bacterium]|nr:MAG: octanoyltransferase LipM [bacterium]